MNSINQRDLVDTAILPIDDLLSREICIRLGETLSRMPRELQRILRWRFRKGMTYKQHALAVLDEFETFAATLRVKFPLHVGRLVTLIYIGLKRHSVFVQMGNEPAALEVENHLRSVVETSKGEIGFKDALRHVAKGTPLPESIQRLLVE